LSTATYPVRTADHIESLRTAMDRMAQFAEERLAALRREDYPSERAYKRELTRRRNAVSRAQRIRQAMGA
jgi:predicted secreted Zn-dependent protease